MVAHVVAGVHKQDVGIAFLAVLIKDPVVESRDHLALGHLGVQAAVGVGTAVIAVLIGQFCEALLGGLAVLPLLQELFGLFLLSLLQLLYLILIILCLRIETGGIHLAQDMTDIDGIVIVAAAVMEGHHVVAAVTLHQTGITRGAVLVKDPLAQLIAIIGCIGLAAEAGHLVILGNALHIAAGLDQLQSLLGSLLGGLGCLLVLLFRSRNALTLVVLGGLSRTREENVVIIDNIEVVLILLIICLCVLVRILQAVLMGLAELADPDAVVEDILKYAHGHVGTKDSLQISLGGHTGLLCIGAQGLQGLVHILLHVLGELKVLLGSGILQGTSAISACRLRLHLDRKP